MIILLDKKQKAGLMTTRNRMISLFSKFFNFAIERGHIEINPAAGIKRTKTFLIFIILNLIFLDKLLQIIMKRKLLNGLKIFTKKALSNLEIHNSYIVMIVITIFQTDLLKGSVTNVVTITQEGMNVLSVVNSLIRLN